MGRHCPLLGSSLARFEIGVHTFLDPADQGHLDWHLFQHIDQISRYYFHCHRCSLPALVQQSGSGPTFDSVAGLCTHRPLTVFTLIAWSFLCSTDGVVREYSESTI